MSIRTATTHERATTTRRAAAFTLLATAVAATLLTVRYDRGASRLPAMAVDTATTTATSVAQLARPALVETPEPQAWPAVQTQSSITRRGGVLVIDIRAMPLAAAVRQLKVLTRSSLEGAELMRNAEALTTLHWQGTNAAVAWQQLLGTDNNYIARCGEHTCQVHVLGLSGANRTDTAPMSNSAALSGSFRPARLQPDPPGLFPSDG